MGTRTRTPVISEDQVTAAEAEIVEQSKRIDFYITEYSAELLASKMRDGEFQVPAYQREFTWEPERRSRFIESLVMGLPIPFLYLLGNGRRAVGNRRRIATSADNRGVHSR